MNKHKTTIGGTDTMTREKLQKIILDNFIKEVEALSNYELTLMYKLIKEQFLTTVIKDAKKENKKFK